MNQCLPSPGPSPSGAAAGIRVEAITSDHPDFPMAAAIRHAVFVGEQQVPEEEEWDDIDQTAVHLLAMLDGDAVATLRFYDDDGWLHVGRVAVLPAWRGRGLGRLLVEHCLDEGRRRGFTRSCLNAQSDKTGFYERLGYRAIGDEFMEANIPHRRMECVW